MAATVSNRIALRDWPYLIREVEMSSLVSDQSEDVAHNGPTGKKVDKVEVEITTPPTVNSDFTWYHDVANDSTSNNTVRLQFIGADLGGMKIKVRFHFFASASGGIDSGNATP